jgi:hypothetical protein
MKYNVGDLVLVKECIYKPRLRLHPCSRFDLCPHLHLHLRPRLHPRLRLRPELFNSYGIVTEAIKHSDAWEGESTSDDNFYVWYSQIDSKEYYFFENEITVEVVE